MAACIVGMRADTDGVVARSADGIAGDVTRASAECVVVRSEAGWCWYESRFSWRGHMSLIIRLKHVLTSYNATASQYSTVTVTL